MSYEIEHPSGTKEQEIKEREIEFKKELLAEKFGWTREQLNKRIEEIKGYLTDKEKEARKKGTSTIKNKKKDLNKHTHI